MGVLPLYREHSPEAFRSLLPDPFSENQTTITNRLHTKYILPISISNYSVGGGQYSKRGCHNVSSIYLSVSWIHNTVLQELDHHKLVQQLEVLLVSLVYHLWGERPQMN